MGGRSFMHEVNSKFKTMPFTLRSIEDEGAARIGITEAKRHELLFEYPVMCEKPDAFVAQFKFTVLVTANGTKKICGLPFATEGLKSEKKVEDEELKALLAKTVGKKKRNKKAKEAKEA